MATLTVRRLRAILDRRFGGVLKAGKHEPDGECCALELCSAAKGLPWTDDPDVVGCWDLRRLNDIGVPDSVRTECLLPVLAAYAGCTSWPESRQRMVVEQLVVLTVRRLVAELPGPDAIRQQCRACADLSSAAEAAEAAAWAAAMAEEDAAERVFRTACKVWLEAAAHTR